MLSGWQRVATFLLAKFVANVQLCDVPLDYAVFFLSQIKPYSNVFQSRNYSDFLDEKLLLLLVFRGMDDVIVLAKRMSYHCFKRQVGKAKTENRL